MRASFASTGPSRRGPIDAPSPVTSPRRGRVDWVVYAKPPFAGLRQVLDYVGRYTHRVAISNDRLLAMEGGQVRFRCKDYRRPSSERTTTITLTAIEFIRRFLMHVLPAGFHRIRCEGTKREIGSSGWIRTSNPPVNSFGALIWEQVVPSESAQSSST